MLKQMAVLHISDALVFCVFPVNRYNLRQVLQIHFFSCQNLVLSQIFLKASDTRYRISCMLHITVLSSNQWWKRVQVTRGALRFVRLRLRRKGGARSYKPTNFRVILSLRTLGIMTSYTLYQQLSKVWPYTLYHITVDNNLLNEYTWLELFIVLRKPSTLDNTT